MKTPMDFTGLVPPRFINKPVWYDFLSALSDVLQDEIRNPISELEDIRHITEETDPEIIKQSLNLLGFDLPVDLVRHNTDRLSRAVYMLTLFCERAGTYDFEKAISFVLGREISVTRLFTKDYVSFFEQPNGPMLKDGGDWYQSTHISLGMSIENQDYRIITTENKTITERLVDAFYEFAPVNLVVHDFYYILTVKITLYFSGRIGQIKRLYKTFGNGKIKPLSLSVYCESPVVSGSSVNVRVYGEFGDPASGVTFLKELYKPNLSSSRPELTTFVKSTAHFQNVSRNIPVTITATLDDLTASTGITVTPKLPELLTIEIDGPDILVGATSGTYTVNGVFKNHKHPVRGELRTEFSNVRVLGNQLITPNQDEDMEILLEARYVYNGIMHVAVKPVKLDRVNSQVYPVSLLISGPSDVIENSVTQYIATVVFSDGSSEEDLVFWDTKGDVKISQEGVISLGYYAAPFTATVLATYQSADITLTAKKEINIQLSDIKPVALSISGPSTLLEYQTAVYTAYITWDNGQTTQTDAYWESSSFYVKSDGTLTVGSVGGPSSLVLSARVDDLYAEFVVVVYSTPVTMKYLTIVGPDTVRENMVAQFSAYANYSDGRVIALTDSVVWGVNVSGVVMNPSTGQLSFSGLDVDAGVAEVSVTYIENSVQYTQTKPVVLSPILTLITSLVINGPSEVEAGERINLSATALYSNGTMATVSPVWSARPVDPVNDSDVSAYVVSPGIIQGRAVTKDTVVIVVAKYFREVAEYPIIVKKRIVQGSDRPISSRIHGPAVVKASQMGSYSLLCVFDNGCNQEIALSNDWSLDVSSDIAVIDQNGFLYSINGQTADVVITATWAFGGYSITETFEVKIIAESSTLGELVVYGPTLIKEHSITHYTAELFRVGADIEEGMGERPYSIEWSVNPVTARISIGENGDLYIGDVPFGAQVDVTAKYVEGFHSIEKTITVVIDQVFSVQGAAPVSIKTDKDINDFLIPNNVGLLLSNGMEFTVTAGASDFIYFIYPVSAGLAKFTEASTGLDIPMDGASWNLSTVGAYRGPLAISRFADGVSTDWYVYRSNYAGLGTKTIRVHFSAL